jgi:hypothetical protein
MGWDMSVTFRLMQELAGRRQTDWQDWVLCMHVCTEETYGSAGHV